MLPLIRCTFYGRRMVPKAVFESNLSCIALDVMRVQFKLKPKESHDPSWFDFHMMLQTFRYRLRRGRGLKCRTSCASPGTITDRRRCPQPAPSCELVAAAREQSRIILPLPPFHFPEIICRRTTWPPASDWTLQPRAASKGLDRR